MRRFLLLLLLLFPVAWLAASPVSSQDSGQGRVIVLGMDGVDASMADAWMEAGELPNFKRLKENGTFAPLMPGNPAQSPVSWATLNTGRNPGKHGIFDFVRTQQTSNGPFPGVGFQTEGTISGADAGLAESQALVQFALYGLGAGLVLFFLLRKKTSVAVGGLMFCVVGGATFGFMESSKLPETFATWEGLIQADEFWVDLDKAGVAFRGQGTIVSYPADQLEHGSLITGLGAPDAKGGLNSWGIYTTADQRVRDRKKYKATAAGSSAGSGKVFRLTQKGGLWHSVLQGPKDRTLAKPKSTEVPLTVKWSAGNEVALVSIGGDSQEIKVGTWSDFFKFEFPWSTGFTTSAMVRVWAELDGEALELFTSPLQIDPRRPLPGTQMCWPDHFAADVADAIGDFETLGWACQTHAVKDAELSDAAFLSDIEFTFAWRERMLKNALESDDWKVLFHFFGSPDRVCHMMMRHYDDRHPQYDEALAMKTYDFFGQPVSAKGTPLAIYKQMDQVVGWMLDGGMKPNDQLFIVSDHGFDSFRRQVNLNNWLASEGFLNVETSNQWGLPLTTADMRKIPYALPLGYVDWKKTEAYSMAIGKIYINRKGREQQGQVADADAEAKVDEIIARLMELKDPDTGEKIVKRAYKREDIYSGPFWKERAHSDPSKRVDGAAEITIDFIEGYRAAWNSTSGGMNFIDVEDETGALVAAGDDVHGIVYDNLSPWSGDHCGVDIHAVQGIFFSNRPTRLPDGAPGYDATHLAPTVLSLTGVPIPEDYDSPALLVQ